MLNHIFYVPNNPIARKYSLTGVVLEHDKIFSSAQKDVRIREKWSIFMFFGVLVNRFVQIQAKTALVKRKCHVFVFRRLCLPTILECLFIRNTT